MRALHLHHLDLMDEMHLYQVRRRDVHFVGALQNLDVLIRDAHQTLVGAHRDAMDEEQVGAELRYLQRMDCYLRAEDVALLRQSRMDYFRQLVVVAYLLRQVQPVKLGLLELQV
jgi:hypothetical protein